MKKIFLLFVCFLSCITLSAQSVQGLANEIRLKTEAMQGALNINVRGEIIFCQASVPQFYSNRAFQPVWDNYLQMEMIRAVEDCVHEGLNPRDYHLDQLEDLAKQSNLTQFEQRDFELLLTDAFLLLASHLMSGKVDPQRIDSQWKAIRREGNPIQLLDKALETHNVRMVLEGIKPTFKAYKRLKERFLTHQKIAEDGGWEPIPDGPTLKLNIESDRVLSLRKRLRSSGDLLSYTVEDLRLYDAVVAEAVKRYQRRNGLFPDGNVGKETLTSLNVPVEKRIEQIKINMERCRWLPQDLGRKYIMVNLPAFELEVVKEGKVDLEMIVAVGKPYRQTPVFSSKMTYLVFNPYWTIPPTILSQDVIPAQVKNATYLDNLNIRIISRDGQFISPKDIDWSAVNPKAFPYTLRQEPGPKNALGEVKFMFPNSYNIYLHDTNNKDLFAKVDRALSSGCIRVSRPMDLALYLLSEDQGWTAERISTVLKTRQNHSVSLKEPVHVHMQYWTAFVDEAGVLNFRKDLYDRDNKVLQNLLEDAPTS